MKPLPPVPPLSEWPVAHICEGIEGSKKVDHAHHYINHEGLMEWQYEPCCCAYIAKLEAELARRGIKLKKPLCAAFARAMAERSEG